ncbi:MAG: Xaa-Pro peptidase family protein [Carboxydocellales bacterium]
MKVPSTELQQRVSILQETLQREGLDGALLVQRADTFYYSGTAQNIHLYIPQVGQPLVMAFRDVGRAVAESAWKVIPLLGVSKIPVFIQEAGLSLPMALGLEYDVLPVSNYERYRKAFPEVRFADVSPFIRLQRAVKSEWELDRLEETAQVYPQILAYAQEILRPGLTEIEFDTMLEQKARVVGHEGYSRVRSFGSEFHFGAIFSGARSALSGCFDGPIVGQGVSIAFPQGPSHAVIQEGEPIIVDLVTVVNGYQNDQTRLMALGHLSPELLAAQETALEVEERLRMAMVPGRIAGEVYEEIVTWVRENTPYEQNFMGFGPNKVSFVGHGIGLELDELPVICRGAKEVLATRMVVAIEPKFIFPGVGAVGIEDIVVVEGEEGARYLSLSPRNPIIVG